MRISRHQMFMEMARVASKRSTCFRLNVGAIAVADNRIVSMGYNGPESGEPHCSGNSCCEPGKGCHRAIHAETNAIGRIPEGYKNLTLYTTHSPCYMCVREIMAYMDIRRVVFEAEYRLTTPLRFLSEEGIEVYRLSPSGYLINHFTNEIIDGV